MGSGESCTVPKAATTKNRDAATPPATQRTSRMRGRVEADCVDGLEPDSATIRCSSRNSLISMFFASGCLFARPHRGRRRTECSKIPVKSPSNHVMDLFFSSKYLN